MNSDREELPGALAVPGRYRDRGGEVKGLMLIVKNAHNPSSPFVFTSERGSPFTTAGFARMIERAGETAKLGFKFCRRVALKA